MIHLLCLLFSSLMALEIPQGMGPDDQKRALEILGLGASSQFLSNSYPLGGYSGLEVSVSMAAIETSEIADLGNGTNRSSNLYVPEITIGKGLYNNSDIFIHFMPPSKTQEISKFGASFRWGFYQALFLPLNFSLVVHADTLNIKNRISSKNLGADLLMGMTLSEFSFFLGGGYANASGNFIGGTSGVTLSNATENQKVESSHFMFGATYNFEPFFIGASLNRFVGTVYTVKTGFLF
jgi:hypothetical protein